MVTTTTIVGETRIILNPAAISAELGPIILRELLVRGERVKQEAVRIVPVKTGNLRDHHVKRLVRNDKGEPSMLVGVEQVPYAIFVHEGTSPHSIDARAGGFLVFTGRDGTTVFTKHVDHPGNRPNRWLLRALPAAG